MFTQREKTLVEMWVAGKHEREIGDALNISVATVTWKASELRRRGVPLPKRTRTKGEVVEPRDVSLEEMCEVIGLDPKPYVRKKFRPQEPKLQCAARCVESRCFRVATQERMGYAVCTQHKKNQKFVPWKNAPKKEDDTLRLKTEFLDCDEYWKEPAS